MAKRTSKVQRATAVPEHPDTIALALSSGYSVLVEPMPYAVYQKLKEQQQKRFPEPSLPMVEIALEDGSSASVVAGNDSPEAIQYMIDIAEVARQRTEFTLDFMLDHYLVGLVDATEADVLADKRISKNLAMMRLLDDDVPNDDDPELWGYVFRHCVLASRADYELVRNSILLLTSPVSQEEIAEAGASFGATYLGKNVLTLSHEAFDSKTNVRISPEMHVETVAAARGLTPGQFWELPRAERARMIAYHDINWRVEALQRWEQNEKQKREQKRTGKPRGLRR